MGVSIDESRGQHEGGRGNDLRVFRCGKSRADRGDTSIRDQHVHAVRGRPVVVAGQYGRVAKENLHSR